MDPAPEPRRRLPRRQLEVGASPLTEYVELIAWFHPNTGDGIMILTRRREDGTEETLCAEKRIEHALGPFDADIWVPRMARSWVSAVRRMTDWASLDGVFGNEPEPAGDASSSDPTG